MALSRRGFLGGLAAAATAVASPFATSRGALAHHTPHVFRAYSLDSFYKSRADTLPVNTTRTQQFHTFMANHKDQGLPVAQGGKGITWPKVNVNPEWAMSYDVSDSTDPVWKLAGGNTGHSKLVHLTTQGFHMADSVADTFPTGDQDRPCVIIDRGNGYTVQFADAVANKTTRTITVSNAACFWHGSNGLDYRNPLSNDQRNFSSRGRIPDAMIVRRDLIDNAIAHERGLGHVLHLFFVETKTTDGFCHPMVGEEGDKVGFGAEGERIAVKPSVDLVARGLTGAALALARTLQDHGAYLGDNSGSATQIKCAQPQYYVGTNLTTDVFKGKLSWNDFHVLQQGAQ